MRDLFGNVLTRLEYLQKMGEQYKAATSTHTHGNLYTIHLKFITA